jgi:signal transduction histidine kinase
MEDQNGTRSRGEELRSVPDWNRILASGLELGAARLGAGRILALRDERGAWHLSGESDAETQRGLEALDPLQIEDLLGARVGEGWLLRIGLSLKVGAEGSGRSALFALSRERDSSFPEEVERLQEVARHLECLSGIRTQANDRRTNARGPAGSSFVPGLVHELRNFIFGITASLDAFEARFGADDEAAKYRANIRKSLGRLNAFVDELREYGDPGQRPWKELAIDKVLREACEQLRVKDGWPVVLRFPEKVPLPVVRGDEEGLRLAFIQLMELAQARGGSERELEVTLGESRGRAFLQGSLDLVLDGKEFEPSRLFEPFYLRVAGMGRLALPVARRILEAHGGTLRADLRAGSGVSMVFTLPTI